MTSLVDYLADDPQSFLLVVVVGLILLIALLTMGYVQKGGKLFDESDIDMYAPVLLMDSVYERRWRVKAERQGYNASITITDNYNIEEEHVFEVDIDDLEIDAYDPEDLVRTLRREVEGMINDIQQDRKWEAFSDYA